jgi:hypothetical protein
MRRMLCRLSAVARAVLVSAGIPCPTDQNIRWERTLVFYSGTSGSVPGRRTNRVTRP